MVVASRDSAVVTLVIDTGKDMLCLDVGRRQPGADILAALQALLPAHSFRLGDAVRRL